METYIPVISIVSILTASVISQKMNLHRSTRSDLPFDSLRTLPIQLMTVLPVLGEPFAEVAVNGIVVRKGIAFVLP